jgi:hypothetical protein
MSDRVPRRVVALRGEDHALGRRGSGQGRATACVSEILRHGAGVAAPKRGPHLAAGPTAAAADHAAAIPRAFAIQVLRHGILVRAGSYPVLVGNGYRNRSYLFHPDGRSDFQEATRCSTTVTGRGSGASPADSSRRARSVARRLEFGRDTRPVEAADRVERGAVDVTVDAVALVNEGRLLVGEVVDTEVDTGVERRNIVAGH